MAQGLPNLIVPRPRQGAAAGRPWFCDKGPSPEGLLVAARVPTSRVWEPSPGRASARS